MNSLYSLYDALVSIDIPSERARAVVDAMERDMTSVLATKSDLAALQLMLKQDIDAKHALLGQEIASLRDSFEYRMELMRSSMTVRLGSMQMVGLGLLFAALKLT
jgi:hypothetical protein